MLRCFLGFVLAALLVARAPVARGYTAFSQNVTIEDLFYYTDGETGNIPPIQYINAYANVACLSPHDPFTVFSVAYGFSGIFARAMSALDNLPSGMSSYQARYLEADVPGPSNMACIDDMIYVASMASSDIYSIRVEANNTLTLLGTMNSFFFSSRRMVAFKESDGCYGVHFTSESNTEVLTFTSTPTSNGLLVSWSSGVANPFEGQLFDMCTDPTGALLVLTRAAPGEGGSMTTTKFYYRPFRGANAGYSPYRAKDVFGGPKVVFTGGDSYEATCLVMPRRSPSDPFAVVITSTANGLPVTWTHLVTLPFEMDGVGSADLATEPVVIGNTTEESLCTRCVSNPSGTSVWCSVVPFAVGVFNTIGFEVDHPENTFMTRPSASAALVLFEPEGRWFMRISDNLQPYADAFFMTDSVYEVHSLEIGGDYVRPDSQHPAFRMRADEAWSFSADAIPLSNPKMKFQRSTTFGDYEDGLSNGSYWILLFPPQPGHDTFPTEYELAASQHEVDLENLTNSNASVITFAVPGQFTNTLPAGHYSFDYIGQFKPYGTLRPNTTVGLHGGPVQLVIDNTPVTTGLDPLKPVGSPKNLTDFSEFNGYADRVYSMENMVAFHSSATSSPRLSFMYRSDQNTGGVFVLGDFRSYTYIPSMDLFVRLTDGLGFLATVLLNQISGTYAQMQTSDSLPDSETDSPLDVYFPPDFGGPGADEAVRVGFYRWRRGQNVFVSTITINETTRAIAFGNHVFLAADAPDSEVGEETPEGVSVDVDLTNRTTRQWMATAGGYRPYTSLIHRDEEIPRRVTCFLTFTSRVVCGYAYTRLRPDQNESALRNGNDTQITSLSQWVVTEVGLSDPLPGSNSTRRTAPVSIVGHPTKDLFVVIYEGEIRVLAVAAPSLTINELETPEPIGRLVHIDTERRGSGCTVGEFVGTSLDYFAVACGHDLIVYAVSQSTGLFTYDTTYDFTSDQFDLVNSTAAVIQDISTRPNTNSIDVLVDEGHAGRALLYNLLVELDPLVSLTTPQTGAVVWATPEGPIIGFDVHVPVEEVQLVFVSTDGETEGDEIIVSQANLINVGASGDYGITFNLRMWNNATTLPYTPGLQGTGRVAVEVYNGNEWIRSAFVTNVTFYSICQVPMMDPFTQCRNCTWRFEERSTGATFCSTCVAGFFSAPEVNPAQFCYLNSTQCRDVRCSGRGSCIEGRYVYEEEGPTCSCDNYTGNGAFGSTYMGHSCDMEPWECRDTWCNGLGNCTAARIYGTNCSCTSAASGSNCQTCNGHFAYVENAGPHNISNPVGGCTRCVAGYYGPGCNRDDPDCSSAVAGTFACAACTDVADSETGTNLPSATSGCECYRTVYNQSLDETCLTHFCGDGIPSQTEVGVCDCSEGRIQSTDPAHHMRLCIRDCQHGTYGYMGDDCTCEEGYDGMLCDVDLSASNTGTATETPAAIADPKKAAALTVGVVTVSAASVVAIAVVALVLF